MLPAASSAGVAPLWRRRARGVCAACCEPRPPQEVPRTREHSKTRHNRSPRASAPQDGPRNQERTAAAASCRAWPGNDRRPPPGPVASRVKLSSSSRRSFAPSPRASPPFLLPSASSAGYMLPVPAARCLAAGLAALSIAALLKPTLPQEPPNFQEIKEFPLQEAQEPDEPLVGAEEARGRGVRKEERTSRPQRKKP
jgi:hypothetical protein